MKDAYNTDLDYIGIKDENKSNTLMYYQDAVLNELKNIKEIPKSFLKKSASRKTKRKRSRFIQRNCIPRVYSV